MEWLQSTDRAAFILDLACCGVWELEGFNSMHPQPLGELFDPLGALKQSQQAIARADVPG